LGQFAFDISKLKSGIYIIEAAQKGYFYQWKEFQLQDNRTDKLKIDLQLKPVVSNMVFVLRNVYFDSGSDKLKPESFAELEKLRNVLQENSDLRLEIAGHTDNVGDAAANQLLSEKRAVSIYNYLIEKGIKTQRLRTKGYGDTQPLASNDDEEDGREINRRIEVKVLE
jgi:outer membrane protein OmpA-like peptidoglycan-associated protein